MRLPRDVSAKELVRSLSRLGYTITRQTGAHVRLATNQNGIHHVTIPNHDPIRVGTLSIIVEEVANHLGMEKEELLKRLFS